MLIAGVLTESIVDGLGIRYVIFTQGCKHNCKGCHNPSTHSFSGGMEVSEEELVQDILSIKSIDGITLSGGDPLNQVNSCIKLIRLLNELKPELDVWCYTGFTYEDIQTPQYRELLSLIDVLVDGKFILEEKTFDCPFRGSSNQRLIDVRQSMVLGKTVELKIE